MNNQPSTPLDRAKTVHHSRRTDYTLRQFDGEDWRAATNDANNGRDAARVTTTTNTLALKEPTATGNAGRTQHRGTHRTGNG